MKKLFTFFSLFVLIGMSANVFAQDSGTTPALGSTHSYTVTMESSANGASWQVFTGGNGGTELVLGTDIGSSYYTITTNGGTSELQLIFDPSWASAGTTYTIVYQESGETTSCIAEREIDVEVSNLFAATVSAEADDCNDNSGVSLANGAIANTTVEFTITRTDDFTPTSWGYTASITVDNSNYTIVSATPATGSNGGSESSPVVSGLTGGNTTDILTVTVNGPVAENVTITLSSLSGSAVIGGGTVTDSGTGTKTDSVNVTALPDASDIVAN